MADPLSITQVQDALSVFGRDYPSGIPVRLIASHKSVKPNPIKVVFGGNKGDLEKNIEFIREIATKGLGLTEDQFQIGEFKGTLTILGGKSQISRLLEVNGQNIIECPSFSDIRNFIEKKKEFWGVLKKASALIKREQR